MSHKKTHKKQRVCSSCQAKLNPDGTCPEMPHPVKPFASMRALSRRIKDREQAEKRLFPTMTELQMGAAKAMESSSMFPRGLR